MKNLNEIQKAHDLLTQALVGEIPWPWGDQDPATIAAIRGALDVLCWILGHDHNPHFGENLAGALAFLKVLGLEIQDLGEVLPRAVLENLDYEQ
jgi:hypothetical protein